MDGFYGQMPFGRNPPLPLVERGQNKSRRVWGTPSGGRPGGIEALKGLEAGRAVLREGEDPLAGMMDDPGRLGDDFLDHRLDATAPGWMARRSIGAQQGSLTNHAQEVIGYPPQGQDQIVGGKLPRRQALQIQIGFDFGMELFVGSMIGIEGNDRLRRDLRRQGGVPAFQSGFGQQQDLAIGQTAALGQPQNAAHRHMAELGSFFPEGDALPRSGAVPDGGRVCQTLRNPGSKVLSSSIPFDQEGDGGSTRGLPFLIMAGESLGDGLAMEAGIHAHQKRRRGQGHRPWQDPVQGRVGLLGTVLGALPQFHADVPSLPPQIGSNGGVAHVAGIGPADPFLPSLGVVQGKNVHIQGRPATGQGRDIHLCAAEQLQVGFVHPGQEGIRLLIQTLSQGRACRYGAQAHGLLEERISAIPFNGLEVAFALAEQSHLRQEDVAVSDAAPHREARIDELTQLRESGHGLANQGQATQGGEGLWALAKVESRRFHAHLTGEPKKTTLYNIKQSVGIDFRHQGHGFRYIENFFILFYALCKPKFMIHR